MGLFKPLLPVGADDLVIERAVNCFRQAGVEDIRVIVGHKSELLIPVLNRLNVKNI
ncbi:hypothetical protein [Desulfitobacterium hafniense]|uniref:hypothetical protein n=1 Tax=Desulfitobacterium hafniense TaxID=49338 RepID=UPI003D015902